MAQQDVRHVLTILAVDDVPACVGFYRDSFGWSVSVDTPVYVELTLEGGHRIGLYEREAFGVNTGKVPVRIPAGELAPAELYFYCDNVEDALVKATAAGARLLSPLGARPWGEDVAYLADPAGNVIALARATES